MTSEDCPCCATVTGDAPASVVHETDEALAFLDVAPVTEGHALVIPKAHSAGLDGLAPDIGGRRFQVDQAVAAALRAAVSPALSPGRGGPARSLYTPGP